MERPAAGAHPAAGAAAAPRRLRRAMSAFSPLADPEAERAAGRKGMVVQAHCHLAATRMGGGTISMYRPLPARCDP